MFNNVYDHQETAVELDDDFEDPRTRTHIPKAVPRSVHKFNIGQEHTLQLKPLPDRVYKIEKTQELLLKEQRLFGKE